MVWKRIAAGALAAAFAGAAHAQSGGSSSLGATADISGTWSFRTTDYYNFGCRMDGQVVLQPTDEEGVYACFMVAEENCPGVGRGLYIARQTCQGDRNGAELRITSEVVTVNPPTTSYYPDNFSVTIIDDAEMLGRLLSYELDTSVEFYRGPGPVS